MYYLFMYMAKGKQKETFAKYNANMHRHPYIGVQSAQVPAPTTTFTAFLRAYNVGPSSYKLVYKPQ